MAISASMVKELRERTGAGMMECKKALVETDGDIDAAIELMRKTGLAKADKKADRVAAEGLIVILEDDAKKSAVIVEVNCETDFVAKGDDFQSFTNMVAARALEAKPSGIEELMALPVANDASETIDEKRRALIAKIGENITIRRLSTISSTNGELGVYIHGGRIGVIVETEGGSNDLAKDIAMHVAASKPVCVSADQVDAATLDKEREIFSAQAKESGKPDNIIEKMVEGRIKKFLNEVTLLGQPFVKNPDQTIDQLLKEANAMVKNFFRYEVGEGIEKKQENFADEVMAQVRGEA